MAIGVDIEGNKQILATLAGSTSEPLVCRNLLETLGDSVRLVITDGSLTLDDTIRLRWDVVELPSPGGKRVSTEHHPGPWRIRQKRDHDPDFGGSL